MLFSINTNPFLYPAIRQLDQTESELRTTKFRLASGLKVASAKDNGAVQALAQQGRADVAGQSAVLDSLRRGTSVVDVALAGVEAVGALLLELRELAVAATDGSLSETERAAHNAGFTALRDQIAHTVSAASFNGFNLLDGSGSLSVLVGEDTGEQIDIAAANLSLGGAVITVSATDHLGAGTVVANGGGGGGGGVSGGSNGLDKGGGGGGGGGTTTVGGAATALSRIDDSIARLNLVGARFGTTARVLGAHQSFVTALSDTLDTGIGRLVDADIGRESTRLHALLTRRSLGAEAVAIANSYPQFLLRLFEWPT